MEFLDPIYLAVVAILAIFVAVSAVIYVCMQQRWSLTGHGDALQQKEKTVILPPFWATRPMAWFAFAEEEGHHLSTAEV
jgi:hypothetical protein